MIAFLNFQAENIKLSFPILYIIEIAEIISKEKGIKMKDIKSKLIKGTEDLKLYWKTPPHGRYMPFKEIASLAVGGMGVKFICYAVQLMILSVGNTLIGNTIGIPPRELYVIYVLSVIASFPLTAIRAKIIDNSGNKKGKFRPYIFTMAIPTVILAIGFTWMPYDSMNTLWKCVTVLLYNIGFQFFYMFMFDSYTNIINVLSPNTYERSDVNSVTAVVDSFAPTIISFILPLLASAITGQNTIYDMKIYRAIFPPLLLFGLLLTIFIHKNTEEKIVQAKTQIIQIKFMDALRAVAKNKYFWIISLASWIGFLESSFATILAWLYNYQEACTPMQYSIVTAVYGNSALWSMLFAPILIRKIGKRNLLISSNLMSIAFILMMYPVVTQAPKNTIIWLMLGCMFINGLGTSLGNLLTYSLNGDIRDYQQYITGERIDGMFLAIGLIGSVVTMVTGFVLPAIYDYAGLNEQVALSLGYDGSNVYHVLYNEYYFKHICGILIIASAVGAALNAIPYFFYDLTETKQKAMVTVLKIRALFEDYGNDALSDEQLVEAIDIIEESQKLADETPIKPTKNNIKAAKKSKDKAAVKAAKAKYKEQKERNEKITIAKFVVEEINKFDKPDMQKELLIAKQIFDAGLDGFAALTIRGKEKQLKESRKLIKKYYPNGIVPFDTAVFDTLFAKEDEIEEKRRELANLPKSKENKEQLKQLNKEKAEIKKQTKENVNRNSIYNRAAKPYLDAKKLLIQKENYSHYEEIKTRYEESKARAEKARLAYEEACRKEAQEKELYAAKKREERKAAKQKGRKNEKN